MTQFDPFDDGFLPDGYETPKTPSRNFFLEDGDSCRIRILTSPMLLWQWWTEDKKPIHKKFVVGEKIETPENAKKGESAKFVWVVLIWNYTHNMLQLWTIGRNDIRDTLVSNFKDPDIGNPKNYDIKISRTGAGQNDTKYTMNALLKTENMQEVDKSILTEAQMADLDQLLVEDGKVFPA